MSDIKLRASHAKASTKPSKKKRPPPPAKPSKKKARALLPAAAHHRSASRGAESRPPLERAAPSARTVRKAASGAPTESVASDSARKLAIDIAAAALEKKAVGLEVLDVAGRVDYADFIVLMSGRSDRQVAALAEGIEDALRQTGRRAFSVEGLPTARWVLIDFGDVVVHVFQEEIRPMYDLEGLWEDARRVPVRDA